MKFTSNFAQKFYKYRMRAHSNRHNFILNFLRKKCKPTKRALASTYQRLKEDNIIIPVQLPTRRTVLLPKTKYLSNEKNYRPITCLNTSYKVLTGIIAKSMGTNTAINDIWGERQLRAVEGVLGTVDQLIIGRCVMEEMKQYYRNPAVPFYNLLQKGIP